jgi:transposase
MNTAKVLPFPDIGLRNASRQELIHMVLSLRAELAHSEATIADLQNKLVQKEAELTRLTRVGINKAANQPSSKQPEFSKDTGADKKKRRKKRRTGRVGAGNRQKPEPDVVNVNPLNTCPECACDLTNRPVVEEVSRIVEDIPPIPEKTTVCEEIQERKWCPSCAKIVSSVSQAALPGSDIGLRALCLMAYFWVIPAISLPGIAAYLNNFFRLRLSTAGISRMMIRLANIMTPIYEEILDDVKGGMLIFADETGWRVKGILWWLWIFTNKRSAYYWPDKKRGSAVVAKILGEAFSGVLITDAWCAYQKIVCAKQTCMAHLLRKIRKFRDAYPDQFSIVMFYRRLTRLLDDGERLKGMRKEIGEEAFAHRLQLLKRRLHKLLAWDNPSDILKEVIDKVARQEAYILTFVSFDEVPNHNNYGEYIIKKGVLKRKVSGGSMSVEGVRAYAVIQSIAQTCHLRQVSFVGFLTQSLLHYIRTRKPLLLGDYEARMQAKITVTEDKKAA